MSPEIANMKVTKKEVERASKAAAAFWRKYSNSSAKSVHSNTILNSTAVKSQK